MDMFKTGWIVAVLLGVLTVLEYIFAGQVHDDTGRFVGIALAAGLKAGLIGYYFMHIYRVWRAEEAH
jgi:hypothetical protein